MSIEKISMQGDEVTLQLTVNISGSMLEAEERILSELNQAGCALTVETLSRFDTDGSPIMTGDIKWTVRARDPKNYQTPYGEVNVKRYVYQTSRGGKIYVPLNAAARMINRATPRFAKMLSNKYAQFNANGVVSDLAENHGRPISKAAVQNVANCVGAIAQVKEESWEYSTPKLAHEVATVVCGLDGAMLQTVDTGWRESMAGTLSLYDSDGERQHTTYIGAAPEYGKQAFFERFERELAHIKKQYPEALYLGIADGTENNWTFLNKHTTEQVLDFWHASEYLAKAAYAAHPHQADEAKRKHWLKDRLHSLKHEPGNAKVLLKELKKLLRRQNLYETIRTDLEDAIRYIGNHLPMMNYGKHTEKKQPIGSGVTEAACKTLIKQRFCASGMRWKGDGIKSVMSLRSLVLTKGRWDQFWEKIDKWGVPAVS